MKITQVLFQKTMLINLLLGFSSGLPLLLTWKTLQGWLSDSSIAVSIIGIFSLVGLPYTLKFLWASVFDRYSLPFLGRRRGWLIVLQILLAVFIFLVAVTPPDGGTPLSERLPQAFVDFLAWCSPKLPESKISLSLMGLCFLVAFLSASQDVVIDAYRRESLKDEELGFGSTLYVLGYRIAMLISGGLAFVVADKVTWPVVYMAMAGLMGVGMVTTLFAQEPKMEHGAPKSFYESVVLPLKEFFSRKGVMSALTVLIFILLYKVGDTMAGTMATPLYKSIGFTNEEIGWVAKTFGLLFAIVGGFMGAGLIVKIGLVRSLIFCGILQALSTAGFAALAAIGNKVWALIAVIAFEDISGAMGTSAFAAYMATQTNKRFTAYQYALLTSIMGVPRVLLAAPTGIMQERMGWQPFFLFCTFAAIPGLILLGWMLLKNRKEGTSLGA